MSNLPDSTLNFIVNEISSNIDADTGYDEIVSMVVDIGYGADIGAYIAEEYFGR